MGKVINLRRARKMKARQAAEETANRTLHGTPKQLRELAKAQLVKENRDLEARRLEKDDENTG